MNGSLARRVLLAVSALTLAVSVLSAPSASAAESEPAPARSTPAPMTIYPPDIQVTSLGIVHHNATPNGYLFKVRNIGQGPAKKLVITKETKIYHRSTDAFIKKDEFTFTHVGALNPGGEFMVEVSCAARGPEYCDYGQVRVVVDQIVQDVNPNTNVLTNYDDILGRPTL